MTPKDLDTEKLHLEALQLRNQQFYLGTMALAGSGLTALIAPAASALTQKMIPEIALVGAAIFWLVLLTLLFHWSLGLRRLISIISRYLEEKQTSPWETDFRSFNKIHQCPCQSRFVSFAFSVYGVLAVGSSILAAVSTPERIKLSPIGGCILIASIIGYLLMIRRGYKGRKEKDEGIVKAWGNILGKGNSDEGPESKDRAGSEK